MSLEQILYGIENKSSTRDADLISDAFRAARQERLGMARGGKYISLTRP